MWRVLGLAGSSQDPQDLRQWAAGGLVNHDGKRSLSFGAGAFCGALQIGGVVTMASEHRVIGGLLLATGLVL